MKTLFCSEHSPFNINLTHHESHKHLEASFATRARDRFMDRICAVCAAHVRASINACALPHLARAALDHQKAVLTNSSCLLWVGQGSTSVSALEVYVVSSSISHYV